MNQFVQYMLGNAWLLIPILIGLFNVGVRVQQKAKEQKARREAHAAIARHKSEALRTGRSPGDAVIVYDEPKEAPAKNDRQARIEALRKQRMEQLRAMREKRASIASPAAPKPRTTPRQAPRATPTPRPTQRPTLRPAQAAQKPNRPRVIPASRQATPQQQAQPTPRRRTNAPKPQTGKAVSDPNRRVSKLDQRSARNQPPLTAQGLASPTTGSPGTSSSGIGVRSMLRNRKQIRQAIVMRDVLDSPIALRDPDRGPGTLLP